jgi:hypothetical protein
MHFRDWRKQLLVETVERHGGGQSLIQVVLDPGCASTSASIAMFRRTPGISPEPYLIAAKAVHWAGVRLR